MPHNKADIRAANGIRSDKEKRLNEEKKIVKEIRIAINKNPGN